MPTPNTATTNQPSLAARLWAHPVVRIVAGAVLTFAPVPLTMIVASKLVDKAYRVAWPQLLAALISFLVYRWFIRSTEQRALTEFGTQGAGREVAFGLLLGAGLVGSVFAMLGLLGAYQLDGVNAVSLALLLPLAELVLVGLAEEILFRGIVFRITEQSLGSAWAIVISAILFALGHLPNDGVSLIGIAALCAYSVMQAAIYMRTRRLWLCIANHVAWNYCVGQVFSTAVSGHQTKEGLLRGQLSGAEWLTGGAFGVEASVVTVVVISLVAAGLLIGARRPS
ncbi:MAG: CPBP family intramembrane metalloprotease [Burkholderiaceae bacterium]|nr:CPBP family intramembrane metalloprotease [Burkholderiaceae bacterium]